MPSGREHVGAAGGGMPPARGHRRVRRCRALLVPLRPCEFPPRRSHLVTLGGRTALLGDDTGSQRWTFGGPHPALGYHAAEVGVGRVLQGARTKPPGEADPRDAGTQAVVALRKPQEMWRYAVFFWRAGLGGKETSRSGCRCSRVRKSAATARRS